MRHARNRSGELIQIGNRVAHDANHFLGRKKTSATDQQITAADMVRRRSSVVSLRDGGWSHHLLPGTRLRLPRWSFCEGSRAEIGAKFDGMLRDRRRHSSDIRDREEHCNSNWRRGSVRLSCAGIPVVGYSDHMVRIFSRTGHDTICCLGGSPTFRLLGFDHRRSGSVSFAKSLTTPGSYFIWVSCSFMPENCPPRDRCRWLEANKSKYSTVAVKATQKA